MISWTRWLWPKWRPGIEEIYSYDRHPIDLAGRVEP
jgi:hypothetical protein